MSTKSTERAEAIVYLKGKLHAGTEIYTCLRSVNASGMSRAIDLYYVNDGEIIRITWSAGLVIEATYDKRAEALRVRGCGLDVGFHTVATLSQILLGDERALRHRWL